MLNVSVSIGVLGSVVKFFVSKATNISTAKFECGIDEKAPVLAIVNGIPLLRKDWEKEQLCGSSVHFVVLSANVSKELLITAAFPGVMLPYYATKKFMKEMPWQAIGNSLFGANKSSIDYTPAVVEDTKADAVYSFAGKSNTVARNNPIETAYGRNRWYPSYICLPYVEYKNNVAYIRVWVSLGHGDFAVEDVKVGDTSINDLPGCFWQYVSSNLLYTSRSISFDNYTADVVIPADDISGIELKAPNQDGYQEVLIESLTSDSDEIDTILINLAFANGCYRTDVSGGIFEKTVDVVVGIAKESGTSKGYERWTSYDLTFASKTPQRTSLRIPANFGKGRWSVIIKRYTDVEESSTEGSNSQDTVTLESVTGLKASTTSYKTSNVYVMLEASSLVDSDAASKLNVTATRKLLSFNGSTWDVVATRNPVWAILDILRSTYGANQPDVFLDLNYFYQQASKINTNFDFVFNQKTTVSDAIRTIGNSFRGLVYPVGSDYRISLPSRDDLPVVVFTPDNASDVTWTLCTRKQLDCDCVDVSYVDPVTGTEAQVRFTPPGSLGVNPRSLKASGCSDRTQAWRQGAYSYMTETLGRDSVTFTTAETGMLPVPGDLVALSWPFPSWGTGGAVESYAASVLTVSEDLPVPSGQAWVMLQTPEGQAWGPYVCTRTGTRTLLLATEPPAGIDFSGLGKHPVFFLFGEGSEISKWFRVETIDYAKDSTKISASLFNPEVFAYDEMEAPVDDKVPVVTTSEILEGIEVEFYDSSLMRVTWKPVANATGYRIRYTWNPNMGSNPTDLFRRSALSYYVAYLDGGGSHEQAPAIGTSAWIGRSTGDLFIEVTPYINGVLDYLRNAVWRGQFTATVGRASVLILGNFGVNAQASLAYSATGSTRTQELAYLDFYSDVPVGFDATIKLTPRAILGGILTDYGTIERIIDSKGRVTITADELEQAGWISSTPNEEPIASIDCQLTNADGTNFMFNVALDALDWATGYNEDSLSVSVAAHGYYNLTGYPTFPNRYHQDFRLNAYYDYTAKLKQPNKSADRTQTWEINPTPVSRQAGDTWNSNTKKKVRCFVHGYLSTNQFRYGVTAEGAIRCGFPIPASWTAFSVWRNEMETPYPIVENTPEVWIKMDGAIVLAFKKDPDQHRNEISVQLDRSVYPNAFLFIQYDSGANEWYIRKNKNLFSTFNPSDNTPLTSDDLNALDGAYLVLPEWPLPRGFNWGNVECRRRAQFIGTGPLLTTPLVLGVA